MPIYMLDDLQKSKGELVYEVRLKKLTKSARTRLHKKWRWDVTFYLTTDPVNPGVRDGRWHLGSQCGYTRWQWRALDNIAYWIENNAYKKYLREH